MISQKVEGDEVEAGMSLLREIYAKAKEDKREEVPLSELRVGLKCGGSDGFSGITANPLLGMFSDFLVAQGGTSVLTEVPEMFGAETILMSRCQDKETFDKTVRSAWKKGIEENVTAKEIGQYFDGACLLVCVKGQTKEMILNDIKLAWENFEYFNINVFIENSTNEKCDTELARWFAKEIAPKLAKYENIEVLLNNTDLGVG